MAEEIENNLSLLDQVEVLKGAYIKLLNDKEVLIHWGKPQLEALYSTRIGCFLISRLQAQLRIKALHLKIEKLTASVNRNEQVDVMSVELEVAAMLAEAEAKIMAESEKLQSARQLLTHLETPGRSGELRKLYRDLAKRLHPDVNEQLSPELVALWHQVQEAYQGAELESLKALQIVYEHELFQAAAIEKQMSEEQLSLKIQALSEGIRALQEDIVAIRSEFPFTIEEQIKDEAWVKAETEKLESELEQLKEYEARLTLQYKHIIELL